MLMNTSIGDIIPLRAAGNLVSDHLIYSTEVACKKQGVRLILLMGNSKNSFVKEALECHLSCKSSYLRPLLQPALCSEKFTHEKLKNEDINVLVDEITLWNLDESKQRIVGKNEYIRERICQGNLGLSTAFFNRKTGKIDFTPLYRPA